MPGKVGSSPSLCVELRAVEMTGTLYLLHAGKTIAGFSNPIILRVVNHVGFINWIKVEYEVFVRCADYVFSMN